MAEVDAFIFAELQQSGWLEDFSDSSCWTVSRLSSDTFIVLVLKFLTRLQDEDDSVTFTLPPSDTTAPVGVAARHRVGSKLANILKELGYAGDCGYNHFLYPSEKETRNILSWLVGKLPRSKVEEKEENKSQKCDLGRMRAAEDDPTWQDSVLDNDRLGNIFSSWKQEKTLHALPNREVKGLRGFQRLPLRTSPLELSWSRQQKSTHKLFKGFPSNSVKLTSLLEALAIAKRDTAILLGEDEFEEEIDMKEVGLGQSDGELKNAGNAEDSGYFAPHEAETEDDEFDAIGPQSFLATVLPDVPISLDTPSPEGADFFTEADLSMESERPGSIDIGRNEEEATSNQEEGDTEQTFDEVQKQVSHTERRITAMRKVLDRKRRELRQVEQRICETLKTGEDMQKQLARQKQLVAMLPQAQANIAKLQTLCKTNAEKKDEIAQQAEVARKALLTEYEDLRGQKSSRKTRCRQLIREIKTLRAEMQKISGTMQSKTESLQALERVRERQLAKLGKKRDFESGLMTRNMYTSRIMDIIKQVNKQKQDIAKILEDIKELQKQSNAASEKLKRTEAVAEEKLYSAACNSQKCNSTKAEAYVECYRKFAQVRELFEELIVVVGEAGKKENTIRDLHNWISQLEARESSNHLDKVLADLDSVRKENGALQHELRARIRQ